ncbi:MAG: hypothetical protein KAT90_14360 [Gammaproteobacteria bacterium]|nr:hypothetical protein [Gammaproteobacteria bacterium]
MLESLVNSFLDKIHDGTENESGEKILTSQGLSSRHSNKNKPARGGFMFDGAPEWN